MPSGVAIRPEERPELGVRIVAELGDGDIDPRVRHVESGATFQKGNGVAAEFEIEADLVLQMARDLSLAVGGEFLFSELFYEGREGHGAILSEGDF